VVDRARLGHEARHDLAIDGELARQHLDGDALADHGLDRPVDRAEAAAAEHLLDDVLADRLPLRERDVAVGRRHRGGVGGGRRHLGVEIREALPGGRAVLRGDAHRLGVLVTHRS
jgi:hypothetical protein